MTPLPVVRLRVAGARGHLTFFKKMVRKPDDGIQAGRIVQVHDRTDAFVGYGFYHPRSQIAVRMLTFEKRPPDAAFFRGRLADAARLRHEVLSLPRVTNAYRVCHAEGDGLSGLIIDRCGKTLVVELHSLGMYHRLEWVRPALAELFPGTQVLLTVDRVIAQIEGFTLPRQDPSREVVEEHGAKFHVLAGGGQKTGFFCDQRDNRAAVGRMAKGRAVLDLCTYTGGFAVHAALGGAARVVGVDLDEEALETARQNARLNKVKIDFLHADLFNYLRQAKETFDLIILDPPKMAREPAEVAKARKAYFDMNRMTFEKVAPGGVVVSCSCSGLVSEPEFLEILRNAAHAAGRTLHVFFVAGAGPDHPVSSMHPEGRYLKAVFSVVRA